MKKFLIFFLLIFSFSAFPAQALKEFKTDYRIDYSVDNRGIIISEQKITLTNNFANIYPKEYLVETTQKVTHVSAWDGKGNILKEVYQGEGKTKIKLSFNEEIIGRGESFQFTIKYQLEDLALHKGRVWEINLPQLTNYKQADSVQITVSVPNNFGKLAYSSTKVERVESSSHQNKYFLSPGAGQQAASLSFGDFQSFDFSLNYRLENPDYQPWEFSVAVPPITNYQEVVLTELRPLPEKIKVDQSGNWLAIYELGPQESLPVLIEGQAKIFALPQPVDFYNQKEILALFLEEREFWPVSASPIKELAQELKTPQKIYEYVVNHLGYNYEVLESEKIRRKGALEALRNPQNSVCSEFTDLFVALARAAGIPAREIEGFAYTNNPRLKPLSLKKDVLHAWPEYWDSLQERWLQVDPTWEKTTGGVDYFNHFDFNHLTFVIHGEESSFPYPPGSYPDKNSLSGKNIEVKFATQEIPLPSDQELLEKIALEITRSEGQNQLLLKNNSLYPIRNISINDQKINLIPPLGREIITFSFGPYWKQFLFSPQVSVSLELTNSSTEKLFTLKVLSAKEESYRQILLVFLIIATGSALSLFALGLIKKVAKRS